MVVACFYVGKGEMGGGGKRFDKFCGLAIRSQTSAWAGCRRDKGERATSPAVSVQVQDGPAKPLAETPHTVTAAVKRATEPRADAAAVEGRD